jgi:hypothetical protein
MLFSKLGNSVWGDGRELQERFCSCMVLISIYLYGMVAKKVLMLEDNGPYLLFSALSLFLLLDLFADLLPCSSSGRYFSPVSTPPLLEDQLL